VISPTASLLESRSRLALGPTESSLIQLYIQVRTDRGVYELCNERFSKDGKTMFRLNAVRANYVVIDQTGGYTTACICHVHGLV